MKWLRALVASLLALGLSACLVAGAADDIIIDVVDNSLRTGTYNIPLASTDKPISIGMENGNVIVTVASATGGSIRLDLGQGRVALTRRANPFVRIEQAASTDTGGGTQRAGQDDGSGNCKHCKKPLSVGDHSRLRCGHYACRTGKGHLRACSSCNAYLCSSSDDHRLCPICGVGFCNHDDHKCYYRHNPAPTPFQTTDPQGNVVYFYLSPDGVFMMGNPSGEKGKVWSPALQWERNSVPTPSPTPAP